MRSSLPMRLPAPLARTPTYCFVPFTATPTTPEEHVAAALRNPRAGFYRVLEVGYNDEVSVALLRVCQRALPEIEALAAAHPVIERVVLLDPGMARFPALSVEAEFAYIDADPEVCMAFPVVYLLGDFGGQAAQTHPELVAELGGRCDTLWVSTDDVDAALAHARAYMEAFEAWWHEAMAPIRAEREAQWRAEFRRRASEQEHRVSLVLDDACPRASWALEE